MFQKRSLKILLAAVLLISVVGYLAFRPTKTDGVVDHKTITGTRDSISYTIVTITDTEVIVKDEEFNEDFKVSTTINKTLAHSLGSWYDEINYVISVRTGDETVAYFVRREDFNRAGIGHEIRFEILRLKMTTIRITSISTELHVAVTNPSKGTSPDKPGWWVITIREGPSSDYDQVRFLEPGETAMARSRSLEPRRGSGGIPRCP